MLIKKILRNSCEIVSEDVRIPEDPSFFIEYDFGDFGIISTLSLESYLQDSLKKPSMDFVL